MRSVAVAGLLFLGAPALLVSQRGTPAGVPVAAKEEKSCKALATCISSVDSSPPRRLDGRGGQPPDYDFNHTADANESGSGANRKYVYEHQIQNKNPNSVLWVEWRDANIPFQLVQPCDCTPGCRESGIAPHEKADSQILFGQSKNFPPQIASAYVLQGQSKGSAPLPPSLTTRLFTRLTDFVLDFTFTTEALTDNRLRYTIQHKSAGTGTVLFSVPAITSRWTQFRPLGPALQDSTWRTLGQPVTANSLFVAPAVLPATWTVAAPPAVFLREESAEISVFLNNQDRLLARGVVSVYLPVQQTN